MIAVRPAVLHRQTLPDEGRGRGPRASSRFRALLIGTLGAELVEAALVSIILFILLIGIVWAGRAYNIYATITRAAREGARYAVVPTCSTCGKTYPSDSAVEAVVDQALSASSLQPSALTGWTTIPSGGQGTLITVRFSYPVPSFVPFFSSFGLASLSTSVQMIRE